MMTLPARPPARPARRDYHPCRACGAEMFITLGEDNAISDDVCAACLAAVAPPRISRTPAQFGVYARLLRAEACPLCAAGRAWDFADAVDEENRDALLHAANAVALAAHAHAPDCPRHRPAAGMEVDGDE